jgi:hypothetical protein
MLTLQKQGPIRRDCNEMPSRSLSVRQPRPAQQSSRDLFIGRTMNPSCRRFSLGQNLRRLSPSQLLFRESQSFYFCDMQVRGLPSIKCTDSHGKCGIHNDNFSTSLPTSSITAFSFCMNQTVPDRCARQLTARYKQSRG